MPCASNRCQALYRLCELLGLLDQDATVNVQLLAEQPRPRFFTDAFYAVY